MPPKAQNKENAPPFFELQSLLSNVRNGWATVAYKKGQTLFSQGDPADCIFQIQSGKVKLTVVSSQGKEAVIALLSGGDFAGEGCLVGQARRVATATTMTDCLTLRLEKPEMARVLRDEPVFSQQFLHYVLSRKTRVEEDLVDHLFNTSEKRLARALLLLANFETDRRAEPVIAKVSQEMLAEIIGTTRPRVNYFMNKFRKLGLIDYSGGELRVRNSLLQFVLHD